MAEAGQASYGACEQPPQGSLPEAMDAETYREILETLPKLRGAGHPEKQLHDADTGDTHIYRAARFCGKLLRVIGDEGAHGRYTDAELKLRVDLAAGKASWYGDYLQDLWGWTRNCNPILALFFSHPLHPVSRAERIFITLLHSVFILMVSSLTPQARLCVQDGLLSCGAPGPSSSAERAWVCCVSHQVGLSWFIAKVPLHVGGTLYAVLVNTIFAQLMYQVGAGCFCMQDRRPVVRRFWELMGHLFMFAVLLAMVFPMVVWLRYDIRHGLLFPTIRDFIINKPAGVLGTTALQTLIFSCKWWSQRKDDASLESFEHFHVTAPDYQAFAAACYKTKA